MGTWGVPTPPVTLSLTMPASDQRVTYALERLKEWEGSVEALNLKLPEMGDQIEACHHRVSGFEQILSYLERRVPEDPRVPGIEKNIVDIKAELTGLIGAEAASTTKRFMDVSDWQASLMMWQASTDSILLESSEWRRRSDTRSSMAEGRLAGLQAHLDTVEEQNRAARFSLETSIRLLEDRTKADLSRFGERVFDRINEVEAEVGRIHNKEIPRVERIIGEVAQQVVDIEKRVIPDAVDSLKKRDDELHGALALACDAMEQMSAEVDALKQELALTWRQRFKRWWKRRFHGGS